MTTRNEADHQPTSDRASPIRLFVDAVKGMTITPFVRVICVALTAVYTLLAWDPLFNPNQNAYDNPVFDAARQFASMQAWGVGFAISAALLLFAAVSGRAAVYVIGIVVATAHLAGWASMIIYESWSNPNAELTSGAYALYGGTLIAVTGLAFSPRQIAVEKPIVAILEDNTVKPLRRIG